jgi:hypothetical protein
MASADVRRLETTTALASERPGRAHGVVIGGLLMTEAVGIERSADGVWTEVATEVPATFEELDLDERVALATWTHKPLLRIWLLPDVDVREGDRIVRSDGSRWYVRGAPLAGPGRAHLAALTEAAAEDGLFAARIAAEPT